MDMDDLGYNSPMSTIIELKNIKKSFRNNEGQELTVICSDSGVQLDHGTGLNMVSYAGYMMRSGDVSVFMYHTGGTVWDEVSRGRY